MENQWIVEKMKTLKRLYKECEADEIALSRYIGCMIRILNNLVQMTYSQFHFYEKQILLNALKVFTEHFIEQTEAAKRELDTEKKMELIDDIENAVDKMTGVYKNVIDSTANSDRQMLSSISIDTSIYELSPKICAFYSLILNKLVEMFAEDSGEYAFVLHPTLKRTTEAKVMFEQRKRTGKVVIIYISESIIERFDAVTVFILHEAFHVLTKKERNRKLRFGYFIQLMFAGLKQELFKGVFTDAQSENEKIENELFRLFFHDRQDELSAWKEKSEESRDFYSNEIKQWGNRYFTKCLVEINACLDNYVRETLSEKKHKLNFDEYEQLYQREEKIIEQIRENLLLIMGENRVLDLAERFLFICREIYADIACILTLQLRPEDYQDAFDKSKQLNSDERYVDSVRTIRNYVVASSVANHVPLDEKKREWREYADSLLDAFPENGSDSNQQILSTFLQTYVMLNITPQMKSVLLGYAHACADAFCARLDTIEEIKSFRKYMSYVRKQDIKSRQKLLMDIMMGDFDKIF